MRPPCSYLFAPGDRPRMIDNALASEAEAVVLDLENSVSDRHKEEARRQVGDCLARLGRAGPPVRELWVRINGLDTPFWREDVDAVIGSGLTGVRVPKTETGLDELEEEIARAEKRHDLPEGTVKLTCNIESAAGLLRASATVARPRVIRLAFGAADFLANLDSFATEDGPTVQWARSHMVLITRAVGKTPPIASPHTRLHDLEGLERSSWEARAAGFYGRSALHPKQLPIIHRVFRIQRDELRWARRVLEVHRNAESIGLGASVDVDGAYVGPPMVQRALGFLRLAGEDAAAPTTEPEPGDLPDGGEGS